MSEALGTGARKGLDPSILREYDIRGVVGPRLNEGDARAIGLGFAALLREKTGPEKPRIVVGRDGRLSSPTLEQALVAGLSAGGVDVVRIGLSSTPMLYYAEAALRSGEFGRPGELPSTQPVQGGIQVTGSHNPKDHNGFKIVLGGLPFFGEDLQRLNGVIIALPETPEGAINPGAIAEIDILPAYIDRLLRDLSGLDQAELGRLRIGWDAGNGAAGPAIEALTARLPGEHHLLFTQVDGHFPHHHPDPTVETNLADLRDLVLSKRLDFGVAFDGDADRVGLIDGQGRVVWGDRILAILAQDLLKRLPGAEILADVKSSQALFDHVAACGGRPSLWKTGHSHIKSRMKATAAPLAGEMTGHIFFAEDWYGFDDGLLAALRLMAASLRLGQSIADLASALPQTAATPELRITVAGEARPLDLVATVRQAVEAEGLVMNPIDGIRVTSDDGWWLLRASNTEAKLSARAEGRDAMALKRVMTDLEARLAAVGVSLG
ncbi:phosphoglucomutase/phosphomannomutase PgmG [Novosphingobium rosa]|uniref:phosphoglucomutase/phosphomannomutase PgmG n=1 Tax=Novosphingobium rosa TaxID=76978 RepID=UPI00082FF5FE|nr:phosphomannomutase/phosphoglucomutase [Novosphingobium rosa]